MFGSVIVLLTSLAFLSLSAQADGHHEAKSSKFAIGGAVGQAFPTGPTTFPYNEKQKLHGTVWGRYMMKPNWGFELNYTGLNFSGRRSINDANVDGLSINGVKKFSQVSSLTPIVAMGLGAANITDYGSKTYQEMLALARVGVEYNLMPCFNLGGHAQFTYLPETSSKAGSEIHALSYLFSLTYAFGSGAHKEHHQKTAEAPEQLPTVADADGDGVSDTQDKCAGTPSGSQVNAYGCQAQEKAQVQLNLVFPSGKSTLAGDQKSQIEELAKFMKDNAKASVLIEGHTDNTGSEAMNKKISAARAVAVRQSLINDFKVAANRVKAEGFGSAKPIVGNDSADGRQKNRRVIATISEN